MKLFTTGDRPYVLLAAVLSVTAAVLFDPGIRSDAESRVSAQAASTGNLIPPNSARMKFVSSGSNAAEMAASLAAENIDASSMRALSLASGDLNGDGFPDLVSGHAIAGGGLVIIRYGDERAFAPKDAAEIQAIIENRFPAPFSGTRIVRLDHAPDFLFTGDFDRDTRLDIMTAERGGLSLDLIPGDAESSRREQVSLPSELTALAVSETFSPDGFADVYAAVAGGQLIAYEHSDSIFKQKPTIYSLPGTAKAIAQGRLDDGVKADLAILVDGQVYVVSGEAGSRVERVDAPGTVMALAAGDFIWDRESRTELAVSSADGAVSILSRGELDTRRLTADEIRNGRQIAADVRDGKRRAPALRSRTSTDWRVAEQTSADAVPATAGAPSLLPVLASGQQSVDLLAIDSVSRELSISYRTDALTSDPANVSRESVSFATGGEPVAVLPMRLNVHSRPSLVVLEKDSVEPRVLFVAPEAVFLVTKTTDTNDGLCAVDCSLREAVVASNSLAGLDMITFSPALNGAGIQLTRVGDDNTSVNGDLDINSDMTIMGNGITNTLIQGSSDAAFTGNMGDKAFGVNQDGTFTTLAVTFQSLTVRFTRNDIPKTGTFTQTGGGMDIFLTGTGAMPGPTATLTDVVLTGNASLHSYGGGLNVDSGSISPPMTNVFRGTVNITGSVFTNNDTLTTTVGPSDDVPVGGAINLYADVHNVTISSSTISANQTSALTTANGGGINMRHSFGGTVTINNNTTITNNIAGSDGGGIMTTFNQTLAMTGGTLSGNTSQGAGVDDSARGGGIANSSNVGVSTTLTNVSIGNNIATAGTNGSGGGIADSANSALNIAGCTITGNSADNGGGIAVVAAGVAQNATISGTTSFSGNTAASGSAIHVSAGIATLSGTNTLSGNIDVAGGTATLTAAMASTTNLTGNLTMSGGAINANNAALNITGNYSQSGGTFTGGTSATSVGGTYQLSSGTFTNGTTFTVTGSHTQSGGTYNGGGTFTANSSAALSGGVLNGGSGTFNVTGGFTISGTGTLNAGGTMTLTGPGNFTQSGGTFGGGSATLNLAGNFAYTAGTFGGGTGTFNFNGGGAQSVSASSAITFNHLSVTNASQPVTFNNSVNVAGTLTANGANTVINPVATAVIGGAGTLTGTGTARVTRTTGTNDFLTQYTISNKTLTNLLIDYVGTAAQGISGTTYTNVRLNNAAGGTLSAPAIVNGTLTLAAGAFNVGTSTLTLNDVITITGGSLTSGATGTVIYNRMSNGQQVVAGSYGNLTFSSFNKVLPASGTVFIAGVFTPGGAIGHTITGSTIEFNGAGAQTIPAFNYNNLASSGLGTRTLPNGGTIGIAGSFTPGANMYTVTGSTINYNGSDPQTIAAFGYNHLTSSSIGTRTLANAGTIRIAGVFTPGTNAYTITGSTVEYNGTAPQTLPPSFISYNNLTLNNPAGVTGFAGLTVQGLLLVQQGTFTSSSTYNNVQINNGATLAGTAATTINVGGNWTNNGAFNANGNTVNFNGSAPQTIGGSSATTFNNLTINSSNGLSLNAAVTVNGLLTLTAGEITTGANILTIAATGSISRTSGHVVGNLRKNFSGPGPVFELPVGSAAAYSPLGVTVTNGAGHIMASVTTGVPTVLIPNSTRTLQRYWTLSGSGIRSNLTFNYLDGDVPGPPNDENIWNIIRVTGSTAVRYPPNPPQVVMDPANNRFSIADVESYSDWTAGEPLAPTASNATVAGRIVDATGAGVGRAEVLLQNQDGNVYRTLSNPFGYYRVDDVPSGQTYIVTIRHKRFAFQPRSVTVTDDLTDLNFIAEPERAAVGDR